MIVDKSTVSAFVEYLYFSFYYIGSLFHSLGIRPVIATTNKPSSEKNNGRSKVQRIEDCLGRLNSVDLWELRELALSDGGLLNAQYRQQAWPKLVGLAEEDIPDLVLSTTDIDSPTSMKSFNEYESSIVDEEKKSEVEANLDLIRRDAGRSVIFRYNTEITGAAPVTPPFASERLVQVLENTIKQGNSSLHYYQGFHDVAGVVLHNMDYQMDATTKILKRISNSHLRDAMRENFSNIAWFLRVLLPPLVEKVNPHVHYALQMAQVEMSTICLPWMITWFTHDIHHPETAGRLVDAFLSGHPLMPMYFAVALITHPILKKELIHADCEDPSAIFMAIKGMPQRLKSIDTASPSSKADQEQYISLQEVLEDCISTMNRMPPRSLLDLVDATTCSRSELLRMISSISFFKAPASWSMASGGLPRSWKELNEIDGTTFCVRAKLASGVPMLMNTVCESPVLDKKSWGSRKYSQKKKKRKPTKLKKFIRTILGKSTNKGKSS